MCMDGSSINVIHTGVSSQIIFAGTFLKYHELDEVFFFLLSHVRESEIALKCFIFELCVYRV